MPLLLGRDGEWPFAGYFRGRAGGTAWAGAVASDHGPEDAFRAARTVDAAIAAGGAPTADRRRALSILWARLDGVARDRLPGGGDDLTLLVAAWDEDGAAVSGVGLGAVYAPEARRLAAWIPAPHPLLGLQGFPSRRPGVLMVPSVPRWLVGVEHGRPAGVAGTPVDEALARCGVHR